MESLLQDTQERLQYRCHIYIETNILNYTPASGDLAYPQKLEMMKVRVGHSIRSFLLNHLSLLVYNGQFNRR